MEHEESFTVFLKRTIITFWAYVTLSIMFIISSVIIAYVGMTVYNHITDKTPIIINRSI